MRKSLIITVVIALLCLCGCEAVVTVPESPEPTKASEMLLTTTAPEESTDMVSGLMDFRNDLLKDDKPTEDINDLILKVIDAPTKKEKRRAEREER